MSKFTFEEQISKLIIASNKIKDNSEIFKTLKKLIDNNSFIKKGDIIQYIINDSNELYHEFEKPKDSTIISDKKPFTEIDKKIIQDVLDEKITSRYINTLDYNTAIKNINKTDDKKTDDKKTDDKKTDDKPE